MDKIFLKVKEFGLTVFYTVDLVAKIIRGQQVEEVQEVPNYQIEEDSIYVREAKIGNLDESNSHTMDYVIVYTTEQEEIAIPYGETILLSDQSYSDKEKDQILAIYETPDEKQRTFYVSKEMVYDVADEEIAVSIDTLERSESEPVETQAETAETIKGQVETEKDTQETEEEALEAEEEEQSEQEGTLDVEEGTSKLEEEQSEPEETSESEEEQSEPEEEKSEEEQSEQEEETPEAEEDVVIDGEERYQNVITTKDTKVETKSGNVSIERHSELIRIIDGKDKSGKTSRVFVYSDKEGVVLGTIKNDSIMSIGEISDEEERNEEFNRIYGIEDDVINDIIEKAKEQESEAKVSEQKEPEVEEQEAQEKPQEPEVEEKKEEKESQDTTEQDTKKSDTSKLIFIQQTDEGIALGPYDKKWTPGIEIIKNAGCGVVASAMVVLNSQGVVKPLEILGAKDINDFVLKLANFFVENDLRADNGTKCGASEAIYRKFNIKEYHPRVSINEMKEYLCQKYSDGTSKYFAICHCNAGLFTSSGHVITVVGFDENTDEFIVFDPYKDCNIDIGTYSKYQGISYSYDKDEVRVKYDAFKDNSNAFAIYVLSDDNVELDEIQEIPKIPSTR